ncbi:MAG: hypothetical protein S4CHLAM45_15170 [Chlamydiales bacterium]|nr:hypothetical protein [Chlamydiales bacterium]MCH9620134.1 hypothetical protein [Chlamydiales bacterium]MCH9623604.1 hypothetical protein [Chlamydiales bacterium]
MAVLEILRQAKLPLTTSEILLQSEEHSSERSYRRWLSQLCDEGLVKKVGQKRGTRYEAIEAQSSINYVKLPLSKRKPTAYHPSWLESYIPNKSAYLPPQTQDELKTMGERAGREAPAGTYARHVYHRLLIDLSYNSSRLEGNTYSLLETERLLLEGKCAEGKLDEEKVMILNHKEAIRYLVENGDKITICEKTILTLHYLLSEGLVSNEYAGKIRDHGVRIGGSTYIPYENPRDLQMIFQQICQKASQITSPFEQSFFLLVHLSYLQGFIDVNKRTARLCANLPLIQKNVVPLSFNAIEKEHYITSIIAIYELNDITPLLDLFLSSYERSCELYSATIEALGFDRIRVTYRSQRRAIIREVISQKLTGKKMDAYIHKQTEEWIEERDRSHFLENLYDDLKQIDTVRIVGLGISPEQLYGWKSLL